MIITILREGGNVHSLSGVREARVADSRLFITTDYSGDPIVESLDEDVRSVLLYTTTGAVVMRWTP